MAPFAHRAPLLASPFLSFTSGWGRNIFVSCKPPRMGNDLELYRERQRC